MERTEHRWSEYGILTYRVCVCFRRGRWWWIYILSTLLPTPTPYAVHQCDTCRIKCAYIFFIIFFFIISDRYTCVACHFGHWLCLPIYLHPTVHNNIFLSLCNVASCSFSPSISSVNVPKDMFWHTRKSHLPFWI